MMRRVHSGLLLAAALCIAANGRLSWAQSTTQSSPAPCTVIPQPDPCGSKPAAGDKKPPTEKFPFPGSTTTSPPPDSPKPTLTGIPQASDPSPAPLNPGVPPDKKFPFPGETGAPAKPDAGAGASSSSSSSSAEGDPNPADAASAPDAGGSPDLKDKGSEGQQTQPGRHLLHRVNPPGTKLQSPEEREAEDLQVAHFYMDRGDLPAAYLRSQDAVKLQPDDPSAHFTLAEVALKLNKRDEAMQHYQECLKLDPSDKEAKAAQKALSRFQAQR